jgi:tRNA pseudouridine55 synthase
LVDFAYPKVSLVCNVSSGTYIRSLVEDTGTELGIGAYTSRLRRVRVGDFLIDNVPGPEADNLLNSVFTAEK